MSAWLNITTPKQVSVKVTRPHSVTYVLTDIAPVILIHYPGTDVNVVFPGEARPRSHAAVGAARDTDLEVSLDKLFASGWNSGLLNNKE